MKRILLMLSLAFIVLSCSTTHKSKASHSSDVSMRQAGKIYELSVRDLKEIPKDLLEGLDKMGADTSSILNEYEGRYLNFIFKVDQGEFDLVGKKVGFTKGKVAYFNETRERFSNNSSTVGGGVPCMCLTPIRKKNLVAMKLLFLCGQSFYCQQKRF